MKRLDIAKEWVDKVSAEEIGNLVKKFLNI